MSDVTLSAALEEAYASAPAARPIIHALSIWHDGMVDDDGQPTEIYVYDGYHGDRYSDAGVPLMDLRLEAGARYRGGEIVEHIAVPFDAVPPNAGSNGVARGQLLIDGVSAEITDHLLNAISAGVAIEVTYRAYLDGMQLDGPQNEPPLVFGLANVLIGIDQVRGEIVLPNLTNKRFPGEVYRSTRFPALVR